MSELHKKIDARTKLAGTNKLEILLFSLGVDQRTGRKETFGINVFKVREVMRTPEITSAPVSSRIGNSPAASTAAPGLLAIAIVRQPAARAAARAPST